MLIYGYAYRFQPDIMYLEFYGAHGLNADNINLTQAICEAFFLKSRELAHPMQ